MFQLKKIFGGAKNIAYWVSGAIAVSYLIRLANEFLKARAVRKSNERADRDASKAFHQTSKTEKAWNEQGVKTDKLRDES